MSTAQPTPFNVLVVDDDDFMRDLMQDVLHSLGVTHVRCMAGGREALQWLRQCPQPPSLLISDIYMPGMDGFEFIEALSSMGFTGKLLLCSGISIENLALARDVADGMGLCVAGALPKPLGADALASILKDSGLQSP